MTEGGAMWLTPTYYTLQLRKPHLGATALPVDVTQGPSMAWGNDNISAVTATASSNDRGQAVTITNRHFSESASVKLNAPSTRNVIQAYILAGDSPQAVNSVADPSRVQLAELTVHVDGNDQ